MGSSDSPDFPTRTKSVTLLLGFRPDLADRPEQLDALAGALGDLEPALRLAGAVLARAAAPGATPDGAERMQPADYLAELQQVAAAERATMSEIEQAAQGHWWPGSASPASVMQADLLNTLGLLHQKLGDLPGASAAFALALAIDKAGLGPDHPNVARDSNNLGLLRRDLSDLRAAQTLFERALAIAEQRFGTEHPLVARYVNNLGTVLLDLGDAPGAHAAFQRAFVIDERVFGPDHPSVAVRATNLGNVLRLFGEFDEARGAYECALDIFMRKLGPDHPNTRAAAANLAALGEC
jgi:tetratricopeptide (TPR) repeat protein